MATIKYSNQLIKKKQSFTILKGGTQHASVLCLLLRWKLKRLSSDVHLISSYSWWPFWWPSGDVIVLLISTDEVKLSSQIFICELRRPDKKSRNTTKHNKNNSKTLRDFILWPWQNLNFIYSWNDLLIFLSIQNNILNTLINNC